MNERMLERALREGPPYATRYVPARLELHREVVRRAPLTMRQLVVLIAVTALLLVGLLAGLAAAGFFHDREFVPGISNGWVAFSADGRAGVALDSKAFDPRSEHHGDIYLVRDGGDPFRIVGSGDDGVDQVCPAFSPDGSRLAYAEVEAVTTEVTQGESTSSSTQFGEAAIVVTPLNGIGNPVGEQRIVIPGSSGERAPCVEWSPDGSRLAYVYAGSLTIATLDGRHHSVFRADGDFEWSPDGTAVAVIAGSPLTEASSALWLVPTDGAKPQRLAQGSPEASFESVGWAPDGTRMAIGGLRLKLSGGGADSDGSFVLLLAVDETGAHPLAFDGTSTSQHGTAPVWSPDGTRIAYWGQDEAIVVADPDGANAHVIPPVHIPALVAPAAWLRWAPDGARLLFIGSDGAGGYALISVSPDGELPPTVLTPWSGAFYPPTRTNLSWQGVQE